MTQDGAVGWRTRSALDKFSPPMGTRNPQEPLRRGGAEGSRSRHVFLTRSTVCSLILRACLSLAARERARGRAGTSCREVATISQHHVSRSRVSIRFTKPGHGWRFALGRVAHKRIAKLMQPFSTLFNLCQPLSPSSPSSLPPFLPPFVKIENLNRDTSLVIRTFAASWRSCPANAGHAEDSSRRVEIFKNCWNNVPRRRSMRKNPPLRVTLAIKTPIMVGSIERCFDE